MFCTQPPTGETSEGRPRFRIVWSVLFLAVSALGQAPVPCPSAALTETQVMELVKGHIPDGRIVQIVSTCHIGFFPTTDVLGGLQGAGATVPVLEALRQDGFSRITLAQAQQEVTLLERKVQELSKAVEGERDGAWAQLDANYQQQRNKAAQVGPKDMFETAADYAARVARAKAGVAELDRQHGAEKNAMGVRYEGELVEKTQALNRDIAALRERNYRVEGAELLFGDYDAEHKRLAANLNGEEYWFTVPTDRAKDLYGRWSTAIVDRQFDEDVSHTRYLVDTVKDGRFPGVPKKIAAPPEPQTAAPSGPPAPARAQNFLPGNCPTLVPNGQLATFNADSDCEMRQVVVGNSSKALVHRYSFRVSGRQHVTLTVDASRGKQRFTPLLLLYNQNSDTPTKGAPLGAAGAQITIDLNPGDYIVLVTSAGRTGGQYVLELKQGE